MSKGASNSSGILSRLMSLVLSGLTPFSALAYLDDTIVIGKSFEEHLANLELVLERFRLAGLKLKPSKCTLFRQRVKFLGHYVSANGIEVDTTKIDCILAWEFPRTITELRSFLGLANY